MCKTMADDFFDQMNIINADVGSQYGGSQFEGFDELDENVLSFTQPTPQSPSVKQRAKQQRLAQYKPSAPNNNRRKARALDDMANKFGLMSEAIAGMTPK